MNKYFDSYVLFVIASRVVFVKVCGLKHDTYYIMSYENWSKRKNQTREIRRKPVVGKKGEIPSPFDEKKEYDQETADYERRGQEINDSLNETPDARKDRNDGYKAYRNKYMNKTRFRQMDSDKFSQWELFTLWRTRKEEKCPEFVYISRDPSPDSNTRSRTSSVEKTSDVAPKSRIGNVAGRQSRSSFSPGDRESTNPTEGNSDEKIVLPNYGKESVEMGGSMLKSIPPGFLKHQLAASHNQPELQPSSSGQKEEPKQRKTVTAVLKPVAGSAGTPDQKPGGIQVLYLFKPEKKVEGAPVAQPAPQSEEQRGDEEKQRKLVELEKKLNDEKERQLRELKEQLDEEINSNKGNPLD
jgi:hypothetical protein